MNAQQQDIIRLLTSRGPMTSRELFDVMQDELGYWSQASTHDQIQRGIESLSKILSKMKAENMITGEMTDQPKGRPVMFWSTHTSDGYIAGVDEIPEDDPENDFGMMTETPDIPDDERPEMESDVAEIADSPRKTLFTHIPISRKMRDQEGNTIYLERMDDGLFINGNILVKNYDEYKEFIVAIYRMLP